MVVYNKGFSEKLDRKVKQTCKKIQQDVKKERLKSPSKSHAIYDFPATAVACGVQKHNIITSDTSHYPSQKEKFAKSLDIKLTELGRIGSTRNGNVIGACAEQHSANSIMIKHPYEKIEDIQFSKAYRPRTISPVKFCDNCKYLFK